MRAACAVFSFMLCGSWFLLKLFVQSFLRHRRSLLGFLWMFAAGSFFFFLAKKQRHLHNTDKRLCTWMRGAQPQSLVSNRGSHFASGWQQIIWANTIFSDNDSMSFVTFCMRFFPPSRIPQFSSSSLPLFLSFGDMPLFLFKSNLNSDLPFLSPSLSFLSCQSTDGNSRQVSTFYSNYFPFLFLTMFANLFVHWFVLH